MYKLMFKPRFNWFDVVGIWVISQAALPWFYFILACVLLAALSVEAERRL